MRGSLAKGPDYWSNGHFVFYNEAVSIPAAVTKLKDIYDREIDAPLSNLYDDTLKNYSLSNPTLWNIINKDTITEHGVKFQSIYTNMIKKVLPGFTLMVKDSITPALIMNKDKVAGILMPLRD